MYLTLRLTALLLVLSTAAIGQSPRDSKVDGGGDVVTMRGCVTGSFLRALESDPATVVGALTQSDRYRMIGSKAIRAEIKKANNKYVEVTGRIQAGQRAVVKGTKVGKATIGVGATQGIPSAAEAPYAATIDVDAIQILGKLCTE
jgi:hypothetical protein